MVQVHALDRSRDARRGGAKSRNDISEKVRNQAAELLQGRLSDAALHELFDKVHEHAGEGQSEH